MVNRNIYALLIGVGDYRELNISNLATYKMDAALLGTALTTGLKMDAEHIRFMAGENDDGRVTITDLAKSIASFQKMLGSEDTFILYFSGHGRADNLLFSNGQLNLQSIIEYINQLPSKNKLVILDCCYSGKFERPQPMTMRFDDSMDAFASHGIAVFASSSADEVSRLGPNGTHSMFTGALSAAMLQKKLIRNNRVSLQSIYEETTYLVDCWNKRNPDKCQRPIFRSSIGGTIFFTVSNESGYEVNKVEFETKTYRLMNVKPLSSGIEKRLCAFVILKKNQKLLQLVDISKEIAEKIKYAEVYSNKSSERRFEGLPANAIWIYFAYDETDLLHHNYMGYTIWAIDQTVRDRYFKFNKLAIVFDNIYIFENASYEMIKKLQEPQKSREEFIRDMRSLLVIIVSKAESYICGLQEVLNGEINYDVLQEKYKTWTSEIKNTYFRLSDEDVGPDDLYEWSESIIDLAGWITDCALLMSGEKITERESWLINNAIKHYQAAVDKIREIEETLEL